MNERFVLRVLVSTWTGTAAIGLMNVISAWGSAGWAVAGSWLALYVSVCAAVYFWLEWADR